MKNKKKNTSLKDTTIKVDLIIDVTPKSKIIIIPPKNNIQLDDYMIELQESLDKKVEIIKKTHYSSNAMIERIQSRGLKEIFKERLIQLIRNISKNRHVKIIFKSIYK